MSILAGEEEFAEATAVEAATEVGKRVDIFTNWKYPERVIPLLIASNLGEEYLIPRSPISLQDKVITPQFILRYFQDHFKPLENLRRVKCRRDETIEWVRCRFLVLEKN